MVAKVTLVSCFRLHPGRDILSLRRQYDLRARHDGRLDAGRHREDPDTEHALHRREARVQGRPGEYLCLPHP